MHSARPFTVETDVDRVAIGPKLIADLTLYTECLTSDLEAARGKQIRDLEYTRYILDMARDALGKLHGVSTA
jgi:hypothetical protein